MKTKGELKKLEWTRERKEEEAVSYHISIITAGRDAPAERRADAAEGNKRH